MHHSRLDRALVSLSSLAVSVPALAVVSPEPVTVADLLRIDGEGIAHRLTMTSTELGPERWQLALDYASTPPLGPARAALWTLEVDGPIAIAELSDGLRSWSVVVELGDTTVEPVEAHASSPTAGRSASAYGRDEMARFLTQAMDTDLADYLDAIGAFFEPESAHIDREGPNDEESPGFTDGDSWLAGCAHSCSNCGANVAAYSMSFLTLAAACAPTTLAGPFGYSLCYVGGVGGHLLASYWMVGVCTGCAIDCSNNPGALPTPDEIVDGSVDVTCSGDLC